MSRNTSHDDCNACDEYRQLSRREFVSRTTATAVALSVPAWLPRVTYAQSASSRDVLISIFLRGGADGMSLVAPWGEWANYSALRPTIAIPPTTANRARRLLRLSAGDGAAPARVSVRTTAHRSRDRLDGPVAVAFRRAVLHGDRQAR